MPDAPAAGGPDAGPFAPEEAAGAEAHPANVEVEYTATSVQRISDIQSLQARLTAASQ